MNRRILLLVLSLAILFAARRAAAQSNLDKLADSGRQVDPAKLIQTAITNQERNGVLAKDYAYLVSREETYYDKHGKIETYYDKDKHETVERRSTSKYEVILGDTGDYRQLIERDGRPISKEDQAKREAAEKSESPATQQPKECSLHREGKGYTRNFDLPFEHLPSLFNMTVLGIENVSGRPAYVIEATPRQDAKPKNTCEKTELCVRGKVWIDVEDIILVRSNYEVIRDCRPMIKGTLYEIEWQKVKGEVWLPRRLFMSGKLKFIWWLPGTLERFEEIYSGFRKFRVETRIANEASRPVPGTAATVPAASARSKQTIDDKPVRFVVQKSIAAYQKRDSRELFSLFSGDSPSLLILKMRIESGWAQRESVERENFAIEDINVGDDKATARVSYQLSGVSDTGNGNEKGYFTIELVREENAWKLWQLTGDVDRLALGLVAAESEEERETLLTSEKPLVTQELVEVIVWQGNELVAMGQYEPAINSFHIARRVAEQLHDKKALAWALYGLGHGSLAEGNEAQAGDYFRQALAICETLGDKTLLAAAFSFIGQHYADAGYYRQALEYYRKSIATSGEAADKSLLAITLESVGDMFAKQGNDDQALDYYEKSLRLFAAIKGSTEIKLQFAQTLGGIGEVLTRRGNYARALEHHEKGLLLFQEFGDPAGVAAALRRIGDNHFLQGHLDKALDYYQRSWNQYQEMEHTIGTATALGRIANVYYKKGEYEEAIEFGARAREVIRKLENPSGLSSILTTLGKTYLAVAKYEQAKEALTEAISTVEKLRTQIVGTEHDQELFFERIVDPYQAMVEVLVKQNGIPEAFEYAERAKGRVLLNVLHNGRENIVKSTSPEERAREQGLSKVLVTLNSELQRETLQGRPNQALVKTINVQLRKARLEYEAFETELYAGHHDLRAQRGEASPLSFEKLQTLASDASTSFLEYVVEPERTYLFVLTRKRGNDKAISNSIALNVHAIEVSAQDLAKLCVDFRTKLASNSLDFRQSARRLYDLLLAPVENDLVGKKTIGLVPAGSLWELPFQALVSKRGRYVLEEHALFYVTSLSVLAEMRNRSAKVSFEELQDGDGADATLATNGVSTFAIPTQVLFAVGNPALNRGERSQTGAGSDDSPYASLAEHEELVKTLSQIYGPKNSKVLTGRAATEERVKAEAGKYQILHFSAHGTLDDRNPLYSRLLLSRSTSGEDGLLEAREIMQLNLRAEVAVLSACETARGQVRAGEGLIGMSWALFVAGTSTTVASLWQVDSASTAQLMIAYHRKLKSQLMPPGLQLSKAQALRHPIIFHRLLKNRSSLPGWEISNAEVLRQAALKLMSDPKYRHPFYWAGFVVMGDGL